MLLIFKGNDLILNKQFMHESKLTIC